MDKEESRFRSSKECSNCQVELNGIFKKDIISVWKSPEECDWAQDVYATPRSVPINEVLSLIFEGSPLKLSEPRDNSKFTGNHYSLCLCLPCNELLTHFYNSFREFIGVCKKESEIGCILSEIEVGSSVGKSKSFTKDDLREQHVESVLPDVKLEPQEDDYDNDGEIGSYYQENVFDDAGEDVANASSYRDIEDDRNSLESLEENDNESGESSSAKWKSRTSRKHRRICSESSSDLSNHDNDEDDQFAEDTAEGERTESERSPVHQCPQCKVQFLFETTLICHRRAVHGVNLFLPVPILDPPSASPPNLNLRLATNCPICHKSVSKREIEQHLSSHTRSVRNPWLCIICGEDFQNELEYYSHSRMHITSVVCNYCGEKVSRLKMLKHLQSICKMSKDKFNKLQRFRRSRNIQTNLKAAWGKKTWSCKLCGVQFSVRSHMVAHMKSFHIQPKKFSCKICDRRFERADVVRLHMRRFHQNTFKPPPRPPRAPSTPKIKKVKKVPHASSDRETVILENRFGCRLCSVSYQTLSVAETHMLTTHSDIGQFSCTICNRKLQDKYCLELHLKRHIEIKPLECFICQKRIRQKETMYFHLKEKHQLDNDTILSNYPDVYVKEGKGDNVVVRFPRKQGELSSLCPVCGQTFKVPSDMKKHLRAVHEGIRDFVCSFCGRSFARKSYLNIHEKLHSSAETPYKCHLCEKGFRLPTGLRAHLRSSIHNTEKKYICHLCGKSFHRNNNLRNHMRSVHMKIPIRRPKELQIPFLDTGGGRRARYWPTVTDAEPVASTSTLAVPVPSSNIQHRPSNSQEQLSNEFILSFL